MYLVFVKIKLFQMCLVYIIQNANAFTKGLNLT